MEKKHDYLTKEIAYPIIARYLKTGGLPSAFYKREGLSESQFYTWRKRYFQDHPTSSSPKTVSEPISTSASFHPIQVPSTPFDTCKASHARIELEYPNGVVLRLDSALDEVRLASLIKIY